MLFSVRECISLKFLNMGSNLRKTGFGAVLPLVNSLKRLCSFHFTVGRHTCTPDIHCWAAVAAWHGPWGSTVWLWGTPCYWSPRSNNSPPLHRTATASPAHSLRERSKVTATYPSPSPNRFFFYFLLLIKKHTHKCMCSIHLSARTATRTHGSGSRSVLAPAASNISAQVTSPLETAKYRGVFLRSP